MAANWHPFIPENNGFGQFGMSGILRAAAIIFFAYIALMLFPLRHRKPETLRKTCPSEFLALC